MIHRDLARDLPPDCAEYRRDRLAGGAGSEHGVRCAACAAFTGAEQFARVRGVIGLLEDFGRLPAPDRLPDDYERLFATGPVETLELRGEELSVSAPAVLDERVSTATGVDVRAPAPARLLHLRRALWSAGAAAALVAFAWLLFGRSDRPPLPRLVLQQVDRPLDTSFDAMAFSLQIGRPDGAEKERGR